jgi:predicted GIY-YIG superfamily endonuclease
VLLRQELLVSIHSGTIYLIHFETKLHHAQHYLGFCEDGNLEARLARHISGHGSKLMRAVMEAGIRWRVSRVWAGDRHLERHLKRKKSSRSLCPCCIKKEASYG